MSQSLADKINIICNACGNDKGRMIDIVNALQREEGVVSSEAMNLIAQQLGAERIDVESVVTFYAFLSKRQRGKIVIRLCNDIVDVMQGAEDVAKALEEGFGIKFGETTADKMFSLEYTPCIGMCDQAPAILVNDVVVTKLTAAIVKDVIAELKNSGDPQKLVKEAGDGNNAHELVQAMVRNNIVKEGDVIFGQHDPESGLKKALERSPDDVIKEVKVSKVRGRGGAGFPTGMKWEFTRAAKGEKKYVLCNADEGEPGTFKDRALLTEKYDLMFEGMTIAGYAIGAQEGVVYLRGEYAYLRNFLNVMLEKRRTSGLLGKDVLGKSGFHFDIRLQLGAGAYICGEESALISSCEGLRGDPKTRPPFPAQKGYNASPTTVNNVETFCAVARILSEGAAWFNVMGTPGSPGTKLLSISGDCDRPGIYEVPFGTTVADVLAEAGAKDVQAVLMAGPSGQFIGEADFNRLVCYDDLATGGAFIVFNNTRDLLDVVHSYMEFFVEESCGFCTPCRVGNVLLKNCLEKIMKGRGEPSDLDYMQGIGQVMKETSRCGLGQTSANPILSTMKNFRSVYEVRMQDLEEGMEPMFDINDALKDGEEVAGRKSEIFK